VITARCLQGATLSIGLKHSVKAAHPAILYDWTDYSYIKRVGLTYLLSTLLHTYHYRYRSIVAGCMNNPDRQPSSNHPSEHTPDQSREDTDSFWLNLERLIETLLWDPSALEEEYVPNVSMQHIDIPMTMPGQYPFEKAKQEARQIVQTELHDEHGRTDLHGKPRFLSDQTYRSNESTLLVSSALLVYIYKP
jgi:hypothetical protein